jgi:hypothetical protein
MLILRKLYKVLLSSEDLARILLEKKVAYAKMHGLSEIEAGYFVFGGVASNSSYNINDDLIKIETKTGEIKNITEIDDSLVNQTLARAVHKNYICFAQD